MLKSLAFLGLVSSTFAYHAIHEYGAVEGVNTLEASF